MESITVAELARRTELDGPRENLQPALLLSNGHPSALVVPLAHDEDPAELARAISQARAISALDDIHVHAREKGTSEMSMVDVDAEIRRARADRRIR